MHVRIAWEIYNHQQKEKAGSGNMPSSIAEKDKLRAFPTAAPPPPPAYRSPYEMPPSPYLPHHPHLGKHSKTSVNFILIINWIDKFHF